MYYITILLPWAEPHGTNANDPHSLRSCATTVASLKESSQSCRSLDTVPFQRMRCLPGRRHPRGSQWSKWRGKRVWCIQVTCLSHVRRLCHKMLISGTWLASIYTWIKVVLKPTFSRKPYVKIWICILQLQR